MGVSIPQLENSQQPLCIVTATLLWAEKHGKPDLSLIIFLLQKWPNDMAWLAWLNSPF